MAKPVGASLCGRPLVIGVDCSTTACKAVAWDLSGTPVAQGRSPIEVLRPRPEWHEQRAGDWWHAACGALRQVTARVSPNRLAAVSIAYTQCTFLHQRETFVPVDESGEALRNAILWMDERCRALLPRLEQQLGADRFHHLTGKPLSSNLSAGKILWLSQNEPDVFRSAPWYLDTHAFLVQRLTGRTSTGWGSADPTGLFDMQHTGLGAGILAAAGMGLYADVREAAAATPALATQVQV